MADLRQYLDENVGVCIGELILVHLLWADDLILVSDSIAGLQKQLNGLCTFSKDNHAIVNGVKTKVMGIGTSERVDVYFNGKRIEQVEHYKYVGNILSAITNIRSDTFTQNYKFLCDKGRNAIFKLFKDLKGIGILPPKIMLYLFDATVSPIVTYGSDNWGVNKVGTTAVDKIFLWYLKNVLKVKPTTSSVMVFGELGCLPPSTTCHINVFRYYNRLHNLPNTMVLKQAFNTLSNLTEQGFPTWITKVRELARKYNLDLHSVNSKTFHRTCKQHILNFFIENWNAELCNMNKNPILRTYTLFKSNFGFENYLQNVNDYRFRNAISKFRMSSHTLEVQRGRQCKPKVPLHQRICKYCNVLEDEKHFLLQCPLYADLRNVLLIFIERKYPNFSSMTLDDKFIYILQNQDSQILTWLGKFLYRAFKKREQ